MKIVQAKRLFQKYLVLIQEGRQDPLLDLKALAGISAMIAFYEGDRAEDAVPVKDDGDMLLYQWGTYDWGTGEAFELDITRQFIDQSDQVLQLSLTFRFPSEDFHGLEEGNKWCASPYESDEFLQFIVHSAAFSRVKDLSPTEVKLEMRV